MAVTRGHGYRYDYKARQARREDYPGSLSELFHELPGHLTAEGRFHDIPDQVIVNEYPLVRASQNISTAETPYLGNTIASLNLLSACVMRALRKGASRRFHLTSDIHDETHMIGRAFQLDLGAPTAAMSMFEDRLLA